MAVAQKCIEKTCRRYLKKFSICTSGVLSWPVHVKTRKTAALSFLFHILKTFGKGHNTHLEQPRGNFSQVTNEQTQKLLHIGTTCKQPAQVRFDFSSQPNEGRDAHTDLSTPCQLMTLHHPMVQISLLVFCVCMCFQSII